MWWQAEDQVGDEAHPHLPCQTLPQLGEEEEDEKDEDHEDGADGQGYGLEGLDEDLLTAGLLPVRDLSML